MNIEREPDAFEAYIQIVENAKKFGPQLAKIYGVEVQEMIDFKIEKKVNELIIGMSKDPQFGPMLMIGTGGIYANFLKDVSFDSRIGTTPEPVLFSSFIPASILRKSRLIPSVIGDF